MGAYGGPKGCDTPHPPDCDLDYVDDLVELALGRHRDLNANGIPDDCEIRDNPDLDRNGNGILDSVERINARLVLAAVPGEIAWDISITCPEPIRGGEFAWTYLTAILKFLGAEPGPDLGEGAEFVVCPGACGAGGPVSRCGSGKAGITIAWRTPSNGTALLPPGTYNIGRIRFAAVPGAPRGERSPVRFENAGCLGPAEAPNLNRFTDALGNSVFFFAIDGDLGSATSAGAMPTVTAVSTSATRS